LRGGGAGIAGGRRTSAGVLAAGVLDSGVLGGGVLAAGVLDSGVLGGGVLAAGVLGGGVLADASAVRGAVLGATGWPAVSSAPSGPASGLAVAAAAASRGEGGGDTSRARMAASSEILIPDTATAGSLLRILAGRGDRRPGRSVPPAWSSLGQPGR
jgi:hypothetical protein